MLILAALVLRGVAFEYRGKVDSERWRRGWDAAIVAGSAVPALLWGVAFGNLVRGVDGTALYARLVLTADGSGVDAARSTLVAHPSASVLVSALNPYALWTGATTVLLFAVHGALYLSLRTAGPVGDRATALARRLMLPAATVATIWAVWTQLGHGRAWTWTVVAVAAACLTAAVRCTRLGRTGRAFGFTSATIAGAVLMVFGAMYPDAFRVTVPGPGGSVLDVSAALGTTIAGSASSKGTLRLMAGVAAVMVPVVIGYQTWMYRLFRSPVSRDAVLAGRH